MFGEITPPVGSHWIEEHARSAQELTDLCGVEGRTAGKCGQDWCIYFDETTNGCALLMFDVANRLGPEALRWFADHRMSHPGAMFDETLAERTTVL